MKKLKENYNPLTALTYCDECGDFTQTVENPDDYNCVKCGCEK